MKIPFLVIGGGLSGLAAAIRAARFIPNVTLAEQHSRLGGLNSYFFRNNTLFETGLHAITNYAPPGDKGAPLNRLLRQLKLRRSDLTFCQQLESEIHFVNQASLRFANDINLLSAEIERVFPHCRAPFANIIAFVREYDAFAIRPFISAKQYLSAELGDPLLVDMILCPLMYYGSSCSNDMDLSQFAIMFRAIFLEGMFRPAGSMKDFLETLEAQLHRYDVTIRLKTKVRKLIPVDNNTVKVVLDCGEELLAGFVLSTIGLTETLSLLDTQNSANVTENERLAFIETIFQLGRSGGASLPKHKTIIFYNTEKSFSYQVPGTAIDPSSGVICFPGNFMDLPARDAIEVRATHLANFRTWQRFHVDPQLYKHKKRAAATESRKRIEEIVGSFGDDIVFENTFTPITINRYTGKTAGAIYGSPNKIKDGDLGFPNIYLAGTDQGFLGIVGAMLSGVSITNQHFLAKL